MTVEEARADLMLAQADISYRPKDDSIDVAIQALENQKTGHWKKISPAGIMECSVCGGNVLTSDIEAYKYCHHCGAKMGGDK